MASEKICKHLLDQHQGWILELPFVTGVGVTSQQDDPADCAIAIYVESKDEFGKLSIARCIPYIMIEKNADGHFKVPVKVIQMGLLSF